GGKLEFSIDEDLTLDPLCHGGADGQIALMTDGEAGDLNIGFSRPNGDSLQVTDFLITDLESGTYQVWAINEGGCQDTIHHTVELKEPDQLIMDVMDAE